MDGERLAQAGGRAGEAPSRVRASLTVLPSLPPTNRSFMALMMDFLNNVAQVSLALFFVVGGEGTHHQRSLCGHRFAASNRSSEVLMPPHLPRSVPEGDGDGLSRELFAVFSRPVAGLRGLV